MKAAEQYFPVVLFIMLYGVVLTFESVDEILKCDHSNESFWAVLSSGAVYYAVQSGFHFWVCGWSFGSMTIQMKAAEQPFHLVLIIVLCIFMETSRNEEVTSVHSNCCQSYLIRDRTVPYVKWKNVSYIHIHLVRFVSGRHDYYEIWAKRKRLQDGKTRASRRLFSCSWLVSLKGARLLSLEPHWLKQVTIFFWANHRAQQENNLKSHPFLAIYFKRLTSVQGSWCRRFLKENDIFTTLREACT